MGKKSKNPRKNNKHPKERDPVRAEVDKLLAEFPRRSGGESPPPCSHLTEVAASSEKLQQIREELKTFQGKLISGQIQDKLEIYAQIWKWAIQPYSAVVSEVLAATATNYLLEYEPSPPEGDCWRYLCDLMGFYGALIEVQENIKMTEGGPYIPPGGSTNTVLGEIADLTNVGFAKTQGICESELTLVRFLHRRIPCNCLKHLKRKLKADPEITQCSNKECGKTGDADDFFYCAKCNITLYCSRECQKYDWENGQHKLSCRQACGEDHSGKRAGLKLEQLQQLSLMSESE